MNNNHAIYSEIYDLQHADYHRYQMQAVSMPGLMHQASLLQKADKFRWTDTGWVPLPYKGYAFVSMVRNHPENEEFYFETIEIQNLLKRLLHNDKKYYMLPHDSFHQTIANTFSDKRYQSNVVSRGVEHEYSLLVKQAVEAIPSRTVPRPLQLKIIGIGIFSTVLAFIADIPDKEDYDAILMLRNNIYTAASLTRIGLRRTRPFIGHLSLAYIEDQLSESERDQLVTVCDTINGYISQKNLVFNILYTELRRYNDLSAFYYEKEFPRYWF